MPVNIRGTQYHTVAERSRMAHGNDGRPVGISAILPTFAVHDTYLVVTVTVTFTDGRVFAGSAEVTRGDGRGPQAASPVETAETSAYGRALAMAGYHGSASGIAGYEEVMIARARGGNPPEDTRPAARMTATPDATAFEF